MPAVLAMGVLPMIAWLVLRCAPASPGDAATGPTTAVEVPRSYAGPVEAVAIEPDVAVPTPAPQRSEPNIESSTPALPLTGPPTDTPPPGAVTAGPDEARKLSPPRREPEDVLLAVPRVILTVPRFVLTGLFMPISGVLGVFDDRMVARVRRVFLWNRAETIGWVPVVSFQGGYGLSGGVRLFHRNVAGHREHLTLEAASGGLYLQAYQARFHGDHLGGTRMWIDTRARYDVTPRLIFQGIGTPPPVSADSTDLGPRQGSVRTRYTQNRALGAMRLGYGFGPRRAIRPGVGLLYNHRSFGPDHSRAPFLLGPDDAVDPSLEDVYDVDQLVGYRSGVDVVRVFGSLELDYRNLTGRTSRGFHGVFVGGAAPPQLRDVAFFHYGAELTGYLNLYKDTRILVARVGLEAVHGHERNIPFTELPRLGGPLRLRGYRLNRFRDHRLLLGTLEYRYPIHDVLGGHLFVDVGRVARNYSELFSPDLDPWRVGFGGGFHFRTLKDLHFRIDFSYGEDFLVFFSTDPLQAFADRHLFEL